MRLSTSSQAWDLSPEVRVDEARITAIEHMGLSPIVGQCGADHAPHLRWDFIGGDADESVRADSDEASARLSSPLKILNRQGGCAPGARSAAACRWIL